MPTPSARSLANLETSASTARVLNLLHVWRANKHDLEYQARPFFEDQTLNKALIIKHRLRHDEESLFPKRRSVGTKIVIPVEPTDLRLGGRGVFVDEKRFHEKIESLVASGSVSDADYVLLTYLDNLPSLDPFITREQMKRKGFHPAPCYFRINEADMRSMKAFVHAEIQSLVTLSLGASAGGDAGTYTAKLVSKLLSDEIDSDMEPFRLTLKLSEEEYREGIFCWKGFLYYKWCLKAIVPRMDTVSPAIAAIKPLERTNRETQESIERSKSNISVALRDTFSKVVYTLDAYDAAYAGLTKKGDATLFRDFLLGAPSMFSALGERLGALEHMVSFWSYRFPQGKTVQVYLNELLDIFRDFEESLNGVAPKSMASAGLTSNW